VGSSIYTYYGRGSIPFGQNKGAAEETGGTPFAQTLTSGFPNVVRSGGAIGSAVTTLRQTLFDAVQLGYKVTIVSTGGLTNVAGLLSSTGDGITSLTGLELISGACKELIVMGGGYPSSVGNPSAGYEFNFNLDAASTYAVCNPGTTVWPLSTVPQYFVGFEWGSSTGHAIVAGNNLSQTSSYSPLRKGVEMSRISVFGGAAFAVWDPVAMAFALVGTSTGLFATVQGANTITASNGANSFVAGAGNQYYVTLGTGATNAQVMAFIEENIMAPPVNPWQSTALEYLELEIPFDEGTGATANDLSGNANTATLHNAAWASPGMMGVSTMLDLSKNSAAYAQTANAIPTTAAQSWSKHIKVTLPSTFAANALIWGNSRSTYPYEAIYLNRVSSTTCQIQFIGALSSGSSVTITAPAQSGVYYSPGQVLDIFPVQINDTRFLYIGVNGGPPTLVGTAGPNQNDVVSTTSGINANGTGPNTFGGWLNGATVEDQFAGQIQDAKFFLGYALSLAEAGDLAKGSLSSLPPGVTDVEAGVEYAASGETETGILAVGGGVPVGVGSGMHGGFEN
jgi:inosine-uridine nucleoside N-ribohydrolase